MPGQQATWRKSGLLVSLFVVIIAAIFLIAWELRLQAPEVIGKLRQPLVPARRVNGMPASSSPDGIPRRGGHAKDVDGRDLEGVRIPKSTMDDLVAKGFPVMSNPRRAAYAMTSSQSVEEVVADLGNMFSLSYCDPYTNTLASARDLAHYRAIQRHIKVLRLIEEARKAPSAVIPLLALQVKELIDSYDIVRSAKEDEDRRVLLQRQGGAPVIAENDVYYASHRRYENPIWEFERMHTVAYSAFYIMANVNAVDGGLLRDWINVPKKEGYDCVDMNLWLVACYFRDNPEARGAKEHKALLGKMEIPLVQKKESRWNAAWDAHEFLLTAKQVTTRDLPTISVLDIPAWLPQTLSSDLKKELLANFLRSRN